MSTGHVCGREAGSEPAESKLGIAVYANNISTNIIAMASVPLKRLTISVSKVYEFTARISAISLFHITFLCDFSAASYYTRYMNTWK